MTRAKPKTPARSKALSPALTRSNKKTRSAQTRQIAELMVGSPGWTDATEALFKSPLPSPAPAKKTAAAATKRSSVYRSREASKVMKTTAPPSFKAPAPKGRRASVYQAAGGSSSPAQTRSRRSSVYQEAYATSHSKVFHSPVVTTSTRRMTMATMDITAKSPPKPQAASGRRKSTFTAMKPIPMSPASPVSPAESEVTFNIKGPIDYSPSPKAASPKPRGRKPKASPVTKPAPRGRPHKTSPAKSASPTKRRVSPAKKPAVKAPAKQTKIPTTTKPTAKPKAKSPVVKPKAKSPVAKKRKSSEGVPAKASPAKKPAAKVAKISTPSKLAATKAPAKSSPAPKVSTPKTKVSTPKSTPKNASTVKVTPNTAKALKGSPRVKVTNVAKATTASPKLAPKVAPKTPVSVATKIVVKTPTGLSTPLRTMSLKDKKSPVVTPKSFYATPKAEAKVAQIQKPAAKVAQIQKPAAKVAQKPAAKSSPVIKKVLPKKSTSSPALTTAKVASPKKVPVPVRSASQVTIEIPPKAARILGKTPSNKIKQRKVTPSRTPGGDRRRTLRSSDISIFQTSTPLEPSRKRFADVPISEIRAPEKKMKIVENVPSVNLEKADLLAEEVPVGLAPVDMAVAQPSAGYLWGWSCNIL